MIWQPPEGPEAYPCEDDEYDLGFIAPAFLFREPPVPFVNDADTSVEYVLVTIELHELFMTLARLARGAGRGGRIAPVQRARTMQISRCHTQETICSFDLKTTLLETGREIILCCTLQKNSA